ncbi:MAG: hypothetical protein JKX73_10635, partial [Flavobacteriales bacterium]|nr:hypothetical protein [Flavobacteriales bacterium]
TDNNGCTYSNCGTVVDPCAVSLTITATDATCNGVCDGVATVTPSGGVLPYTYNWSNGATTATIVNLCVGTYTITVTDSTGCSQITNAIITQPTLVTATTTGTNPSSPGACDGDATLLATGGTTPYAYLWDASTGNQTTPTAVGLCAGTYCVTVTDMNSCVATSCVTLIDSGCALTVATSVINATCNNCDGSSTAAPSGGTAPYTYLWNDTLMQTTATATNLCASTYVVTVTDSNGCTVTVGDTVFAPSGMTLSFIITNPSTQGGSDGAIDMTVSGGTIPYTYLWSNANNIEDISNLVSGTYFVTVTDSAGCTQTGVATLIDPGCGYTITKSSIPATCANADGTATVAVSGGTPPFTYLWDDPATQTTSTATGLFPSAYTFWITDSTGCVESDTLNVTSTGVNVSVSKTDPSSPGACDGTATASSSGGVAPYTYSWNDPGAQVTAIAVGLCDGNWCVTVVDNLGCTTVSCITLVDSCAYSVSLTSTNVSCNGNCDGTIDQTVSGGVPPYTYLWTPGGMTAEDIANQCAGTYTSTVTDSSGCVVSVSQTITEPMALSATIIATNTSGPGNCDGTATVNPTGGTGAYSYQWDDPGFQITQTAINLCSGTYTVIVLDANGCSNSVSVTVADPSCSFTVITSSTDVTCGLSDGTATASVSGGFTPYTYLWDDPSAQTTATATGLNFGPYTVAVSDSSGCTSTYNVTVNSASSLAVTTTKTDPSSPGACDGTASATSTGGMAPYTYSWNTVPVQNSSVATGLCDGTYCATVTDINGCTVNSCITLVDSCNLTLTLSSTNVSCNGLCNGSATVSVTGGTGAYTYSWANGDTGISADSLCSGSIAVTIIDGAGCTATSSVAVTEPAPLSNSLFPASPNVSCPGCCDASVTTIPGGGTPPYLYLWDDTLSQTTATASNLCTGSYTVAITDANGCTSSASVTVVDSSCAFTITTSSTDATCGSCDGGTSVTVSGGGSPPFTYAWNTSPVQSTPTTVSLCVGTYTVTVVDNGGCAVTSSVSVNSASSLAVTVSGTNPSSPGACDGSAAATPSGGTAPYIYQWDDPSAQNTATAVGLCAGIFTVVVTDANGCI